MDKTKRLFAFAGILAMMFASCIKNNTDPFPDDPFNNEEPNGSWDSDDGDAPSFDTTIYDYDGQLADDLDQDIVGTDKDIYWEANTFSNKLKITFSSGTVSVENDNKDIICYTEGSHVVVDMLTNSVSEVEIELCGESKDGSLKIYGEKKYKLTLNGISLVSSKGPAINSQCKKRAFVHLVPETVNSLTDASSYSSDIKYINGGSAGSEDRKGCFFSEGNLIFSGSGSLLVAGKMKHGVVTDGYMYVRPGVTIAVTEAVKNAIHVKGDSDDGIGIRITGGLIYTHTSGQAGKGIKTDLVTEISGGKLDLNTTGNAMYDSEEKDVSSAAGIKADGDIIISGGEISVKSSGTGGKGLNSDSNLSITGGKTTIVTTGRKYTYSSSLTSSPKGVKIDKDITISGGELLISVTGISDSSEGLESKSKITINGGVVFAYAYDDAINASGDFTVNGGRVYAYAINNDGIDSNGTIHLNGGLVISCGASGVEESFDCDRTNNFIIKGGTIIGVAGGALTPSSSSAQRCVVYHSLSGTKGKSIAILDSSGKPVMAFNMPKTLNSMSLVYSSSLLEAGKTYTVSKDGTVTNPTEEWNGWSTGGYWSGGSTAGSFTSNSIVTTVGNSGGIGGKR